MANVYAVINQKGGVGKTTAMVNLAVCFAKMGKKVLAIGLDLQMNEVSCCGVTLPKNHISTYDVLHGTPAREAIIKTEHGFDLMPSSRHLAAFESDVSDEINENMDHCKFLRDALSKSQILEEYEIVLIDFPPTLGVLTLNGLTAANKVIIPIQAEPLATEGTQQLLETIELVQATVNPSLEVAGAFMTMYDKRLTVSMEVRKAAMDFFKQRGIPFFKTVIKRCVRFVEAPAHGVPSVLLDPNVPAVKDYYRLAEEVRMA